MKLCDDVGDGESLASLSLYKSCYSVNRQLTYNVRPVIKHLKFLLCFLFLCKDSPGECLCI